MRVALNKRRRAAEFPPPPAANALSLCARPAHITLIGCAAEAIDLIELNRPVEREVDVRAMTEARSRRSGNLHPVIHELRLEDASRKRQGRVATEGATRSLGAGGASGRGRAARGEPPERAGARSITATAARRLPPHDRGRPSGRPRWNC